LRDVSPLLSKGDMIIEAGNSHYKESIRRYNQMKEADIDYLDAGTSGGMKAHGMEPVLWWGAIIKHGRLQNGFFGIPPSKMVIYTLMKREADVFLK